MRTVPRSCASPTLSSERRRRFAKGDCLRRSPSAWLSVFSITLILLGGCGGSGESRRLDPAVAARLADQSDAVADAIQANDGCEASRRVAELRSSLQQARLPDSVRREVARYANRTFACAPPPAPRPPPPPPPAPPPPPVVSTQEDEDDHGEDRGKGHGKQKKKHKKHGHEDEDE